MLGERLQPTRMIPVLLKYFYLTCTQQESFVKIHALYDVSFCNWKVLHSRKIHQNSFFLGSYEMHVILRAQNHDLSLALIHVLGSNQACK